MSGRARSGGDAAVAPSSSSSSSSSASASAFPPGSPPRASAGSSSSAASTSSPARPRNRGSSFGIGPLTPERAAEGRIFASQALLNKNVNYMSSIWFWLAYVLAIAITRGLLFALLPKPYFSEEAEWTTLAVAHGVVSFVGLHWNRGSPFWDDQGEHVGHTVWEQIDNGTPWTPTHKFLLVVPVLLFLVSMHFTHYDVAHLAVNIATLAVLIVPKLPEMHEMRFFGINAGPSVEVEQ